MVAYGKAVVLELLTITWLEEGATVGATVGGVATVTLL